MLLVQFYKHYKDIVLVIEPVCHLSCQYWMLTLRLFFQPLASTTWFPNCKLCNKIPMLSASAVYLRSSQRHMEPSLGKVSLSHYCNCKINPQPHFGSISWSLENYKQSVQWVLPGLSYLLYRFIMKIVWNHLYRSVLVSENELYECKMIILRYCLITLA